MSQEIECRTARTSLGWSLLVDSSEADRAASLLEADDRERVGAPVEESHPTEYGPTWAGFIMAGLLVAFYLVTGPRNPNVVWFERGSASAEAILAGEFWRTITALTLHADVAHILANGASCALFATAVCRSVGPGVGWLLIVLAGAIGNVLNAFAHGTGHSSVGASTAIFGAVGLLAGLGLVRKRRLGVKGRRAWAPVAAGLALLAMLGTGKGTDVSAHLFGFLSGAVLGFPVGAGIRRPPRWEVQVLLLALSLGVVVVCWQVALYTLPACLQPTSSTAFFAARWTLSSEHSTRSLASRRARRFCERSRRSVP
jgi:membrane associated rhomboid family serine protease